MRLSKLSVLNFRNFQSIHLASAGNVVLLGENRVGKSNLLFARFVATSNGRSSSSNEFRSGAIKRFERKLRVSL